MSARQLRTVGPYRCRTGARGLKRGFILRPAVCVLMAASGHAAAGSCEIRPIPQSTLQAILEHRDPTQRAQMLLDALDDHYRLDTVAGVDGRKITRTLIVPAVLSAPSEAAATRSLYEAMALFQCGSATAGAPVPQVAVQTPAAPNTQATLDQAAERAKSAMNALSNGVTTIKTISTGGAVQCEQMDGTTASCGIADATRQQHEANRAQLDELTKAAAAAQKASGDTREDKATQEAAKLVARARSEFSESGKTAAWRLSQYGLYVGPTYSLSNDGSWKAGAELLFHTASDAMDNNWFCPATWCRGINEFSYRTIGALDKKSQDVNGSGNPADTSAPPLNPFTSSGGYFRYNGAWQMHYNDWLGVQVGAGLSALHTSAADGVQTKPRVLAGLHFQDFYDDGAVGEIYLGYAHDLLWQRDIPLDSSQPNGPQLHQTNFDRWIVDGQIFLPDLKLGGFYLVARISADSPINRRGPSDVRASLLFYYDFNKWLKAFDPHPQSESGT